MPISSVNPVNGEQLKTFPELTAAELERKISLAAKAAVSWRETRFADRSVIMRRAAEYLRDNSEALAKLMTLEMGKLTNAGKAELEKCAWVCDYYAANAELFLKPEVIKIDNQESFVRFDPVGAVLAVMPWNFPFWQVFRFAVPAIMAGNVGLLKHASNVPQCALAIEEAFTKSGLPEGVFQTLLIPAAKVPDLIDDPRIAAVTLTGSESAGSQVAAASGKAIKKTVLELGGSDPFIVLADADLRQAAQSAVKARLQNNAGQSCISAKRFIVEKSVIDEFTKILTDEFAKLKIGDPSLPETEVGPLALKQILDGVAQQVRKSVNLGAKLEIGGKQWGDKGWFFEPTILSGVKSGMPAYDEEVFGPVAAVIEAADSDQAVEIANSSRYGLGAAIFTRDIEKAKKIAAQLENGLVFINGIVKSDPRLPFGGVKKSGYGRELGSHGIKEFVNIKTVVIEGLGQPSSPKMSAE